MTIMGIQDANQRMADRLLAEARQDPNSPYMGKFVGVANGQIVMVADDWDELAERLAQMDPDLSETLSMEVGVHYDEVQHIGKLVA